MPSMSEMRDYVASHPKYSKSMYWRAKVYQMPEKQVAAIYMKFKSIDYRELQKKLDSESSFLEETKHLEKYHQMDIWEFLKENKRGHVMR